MPSFLGFSAGILAKVSLQIQNSNNAEETLKTRHNFGKNRPIVGSHGNRILNVVEWQMRAGKRPGGLPSTAPQRSPARSTT